jgi:hypothetical protein
MSEENAFGTVRLRELKKPLIIESPDFESYARMRRRINASVDFFTRALKRFNFSRIPAPWNFTSGNCQTIGTAGTKRSDGTAGTIELLIPTVACSLLAVYSSNGRRTR